MPRPVSDMRMWLAQLSSSCSFSEREITAFLAVPIVRKSVQAGEHISLQGDDASPVCLIFDGLVCSYEIIGSSGMRQIQAYHLAGDLPDLGPLHFGTNIHSVAALRPSKVGFIRHSVLRNLLLEHPVFAECLWRKSLVDASIANAWVTNLGRRSAYGRIAHLFCELLFRLRALDQAVDTIPFWLSQTELSDAQGLSVVHVNRVMKTLRAERLIRMDGKLITVLDLNRLREAGDFDPAYLHQQKRPHHIL